MNDDPGTPGVESPDEEAPSRPDVAINVAEPTGDEAPSRDGQADVELRLTVPGELALLPLRDNVLFPAVVAPLTVSREGSIKLIDDAAVSNTRVIGVVTLRDPSVDQPEFDNVHPVGVAAAIRMMVKMPNGIRLIVQGLKRIRLLEPTQTEPYLRARIETIEDQTTFEGDQ